MGDLGTRLVQFFHLSKDSLQLQGKSYNSGYINPTASALLSGNQGESSIACFVKETIECLISMLCQILTRGGIFCRNRGNALFVCAVEDTWPATATEKVIVLDTMVDII